MNERQDISLKSMPEKAAMSPRQKDLKPVIATIVVCSVGGFLGATWVIEFAQGISEFAAQTLQPPTSYALQFSATGMSALLGTGIGFSLEKYLAEGEI